MPNQETGSRDGHDTEVDFRGNFKHNFFSSEGRKFGVELVGTSHVGNKRLRNEDHFAVFNRKRTCEMIMSNMPFEDVAHVDDNAYGLIVADGVGGAEFGDFASQLAIETLLQACGMATSWVMKFKDLDSQQIRERAAAYVDKIQEAFHHYSQEEPGKKTMGTTLTCGYLMPPDALIAHIGDSRAYIWRDGNLTQITRDQTLAQSLIDAGAPEEKVRGFGNVLVNALGSGRDEVDADVMHVGLEIDDRFLICSDGLTDMVSDDLIAKALVEDSIQVACDILLDQALAAGGKDNITMVIAKITSSS